MHEESNQQLSQFIDNELDGENTLELLQRLKEIPELEERIRRYQVASHVIKNEAPILADKDFVHQVTQAIQNEVTFMLPKQRQPIISMISALAIAASVAVVAVVIYQQPDISDADQDTMFIAGNQQKTLQSQPVENRLQPMDSRFNDYLYAHRGSLYIAEPSAHPYAKLAGYGQ
jgi:sigma-E factor negative regulatory protein RseA